jgi:hypothetical protein
MGQHWSNGGHQGWDGVNVATGRKVWIRSARRLQREASGWQTRWVKAVEDIFAEAGQ